MELYSAVQRSAVHYPPDAPAAAVSMHPGQEGHGRAVRSPLQGGLRGGIISSLINLFKHLVDRVQVYGPCSQNYLFACLVQKIMK